MTGKLSICKSYFLIFITAFMISLAGFGLTCIWDEYWIFFGISVLIMILLATILIGMVFSRRINNEYDSLIQFFKLAAMMSVNTSKYKEIDTDSLSFKEFRELAESANKMFRETKEARKALRESEDKYRSFVERASDGMIIIQNTLIRYVNPVAESMLGYSAKELMDTPFTRYTHPSESAELLMNHSMRMGELAVPPIFETRMKHKDGQYVECEVKAGMITYNQKPADLWITRDIAVRKLEEEKKRKLEEQIQHTQKLESLGVLAGGIAHDFNNLLLGILGNANLVGKEHPEEPVTLKRIRAIETAAERAADLTKQLLAYSGKGKLVIQPLDFNEVVKEMTSLFDSGIKKKARLECKFSQELLAIEADATQIRQVIMNLITNASEAMGDRYGEIELSTGIRRCSSEFLKKTHFGDSLTHGTYVYLKVADNGCGMEKEILSKIFEPFFTTKFTGRGLGLASVLGIIRSHKGTLKVESEPGHGTTFTILFPQSPKHVAKVEEVHKVEKWNAKGTILVVDDEPDILEVIEEILEMAGFSVLTAKDGVEGVAVFREHQDVIKAVIVDMTMPNMGGEETFRELKKIREDIRVIISSGYNEREVTDHFVGEQPAGFIHKPYTIDQLMVKMQDVLQDECVTKKTVAGIH